MFRSVCLILAVAALGAGEARKGTDYGPFLTYSIVGQWPKGNTAPKGIAVRLGDDQGGMCFDTDLLRWQAGWTGGYLKLVGVTFTGAHGVPGPSPEGRQVFATTPAPGIASPAGDFKDPRSEPYGPLPTEWGRWQGLYLHGDQVVLHYTVNLVEMHELPGLEGPGTISRTIRIGERTKPITLVIAELPGGTGGVGPVGDAPGTEARGDAGRTMAALAGKLPGKPAGKDGKGGTPESPYLLGVGLIGAPDGATWSVQDARIQLTLPAG